MRRFISGLFGLCVLMTAGVGSARADEADAATNCLSGERLRWIIPHPTGGGYDTFFRMLVPSLASRLQATIAVENRDGAGGVEGAVMIRDAEPDGRVLGCLNGAGLLCASLNGDAKAPHPVRDYTLLARATRSRHVWFVAANSPLKSIDDARQIAQQRPLVFGVRDVASSSFISLVVGAHLMHLPYELVTGYSGSRDAVLAVMRGEVDVGSANADSIDAQLRNGELRPLLVVSESPITDTPALAGASVLGGPDGLAVRTARNHGEDVEQAHAQAKALDELVGAGRLVVAPRGLPDPLRKCLEDAVLAALDDPAFRAAADGAGYAIESARGDEAATALRDAEKQWSAFMPIIQAATRKVRGVK